MEIINSFKDYLLGKKVNNPTTLKNYLSDIRHFINWYESSFGAAFSANEVNEKIIKLYEGAGGANILPGGGIDSATKMSHASLKRRLSSLRQFIKYLVETGNIETNPFTEIAAEDSKDQNIDAWHIQEFKDYLKFKKASDLTIKNYITDIHSFRRWHEQAIQPNTEIASFPVINDQIVEEYKSRLIDHKGAAIRTINRKLSSLRKFVEFSIASNYTSKDFFYPEKKVENLELDKSAAETKGIISINDIESHKIKLNYSPIPPIRLFQKLIILPYLLLESAVAGKIITLLYGNATLALAAKKALPLINKLNIPGKPSDLLKVKGYEKKFYAPNEISLDNLPLHEKIWHHLRFTRPEWYRRYHNLPLVHYIHFAVLIIFAAGAGVALYRNLVTDVKSPLFAAPASPPRILSFQGRLTDNLDNPITSGTSIRFSIYDDLSASGSALLWQEVHYGTVPDQDGIFSVLLGTLNSIPDSVFFENNDIYLGVTIEQTPELTPRRRIASVPYAANSESLQGMLPITDGSAGQTNVVLALDSSGDLTIGGSAAPTFSATGGQFTLSGDVLLLTTETGTDSNIIISPDGIGKIDLTKPLLNSSSNGNLVPGGVEINDKFGILATESAVAAFVVNNNGASDIFTASSSGTPRFTITNSGGIGLGSTTSVGTSSQCLLGGSTATWGSCATGTNPSPFQQLSGAIVPNNSTVDFLIGSQATSSAKFAVLNVNGTGPATASVSGNLIVFPNNGAGGRVGIGTTSPSTALQINGTGSLDGISIGADYPSWMGDNGIYALGQIYGVSGYIVGSGYSINWGDSTTGILGNSTSDYISFKTNTTEKIRITSEGFLGIGTASPISSLHVTRPLALGASGKALAIFDQIENQDILTASKSGATIFTIGQNGEIGLGLAAGVPDFGSSGECLKSQGTGTIAQWDSCGGNSGLWRINSGAISPINDTLDVLIGNQATASAKFAFLNVNSGTPVASISANSGDIATYITGDGTLATTNRQTLTIGNSATYNTTGELLIHPNGTGNVAIGDTSSGGFRLLLNGNLRSYSAGQGAVQLNHSGLVTSLVSEAGIGLGLGAGGSQTIRIASSGEVGVGTTSPFTGNRLDVRGLTGTTATASISAQSSYAALVVDNAAGAGDQFTASKSGETVFVIDNDGNIIVGPGGTGKITAAVIDPYLVQNQYTSGNTQLTFQTLAASNGDFIFQNQSTELATLFQAGLLQLQINGSSAGLQIGDDTQLFRGSANRLDLASGDSFNVVSGNYQVAGATVIDSSSNATFNDITINGTCLGCVSTGNISPFRELNGAIVPNNSTVDFLVGGQATSSAKFAITGINGSGPATASVSGNLIVFPKNGAGGSLGIGTISPSYPLHINNSLTAGTGSLITAGQIERSVDNRFVLNIKNTNANPSANASFAGITAEAHDSFLGSYAKALFGLRKRTNGSSYGETIISAPSNFALYAGRGLDVDTYSNYGTLALYVATSSGGLVGINTTSPDRNLDVLDASNPQLRLSQADSSVYADFQMDSNGDLLINVDGASNQLVLDNGGNVGIGTATPAQKFVVYGTSAVNRTQDASGNFNIDLYANGSGPRINFGDVDTASNLFLEFGAYNSINQIDTKNRDFHIYGTNTTTGLYFDESAGTFGLGTTTPTAKLDVSGTASISGALKLYGTPTIQSTANQTLTIGGDTTGNITLSPLNGSGTIRFTNFSTAGGLLYTNSSGVLSQTGAGSGSQCLLGGTTPAWGSCSTGGTDSPFYAGSGFIGQNNTTLDFLLGGTSTASAKFAVLNVNGTGPATASVSGNLIVFPNNGAGGNVGIGTINPTARLHTNDSNGNIQIMNGTYGLHATGNDYVSRFYIDATSNAIISLDKGATTNNAVIQFLTAGASKWNLGITDSDAAGNGDEFYIGSSSGGASAALFIESNNYVGIGTNGPDRKLDVLDASNPQLRLSQADGSVYTDFQTDSSGNLSITPSGTSANIVGTSTIKLTPGADSLITLGTSDGSDDDRLILSAGGSTGSGRGGTITLGGNESSYPGRVEFGAGAGTDGYFRWLTNPGAGDLERLRLTRNGTLGLGTNSPTSQLHITRPLTFGATGKALAIFDQIENQDILTASAGGATKFTISNTGALTSAAYTNAGGLLYTATSGLIGQTAAGTGSQCLLGGTTPSFGSCATGITTSPFWGQSNGALYPNNSTVDFLVGGQASSSAKFAVLNVNGTGGATATVSGSLIVMPRNGDGGFLGVQTDTPRGALDVGRGTAYFGNPGVTHAMINSYDGFYFNTDADNNASNGDIRFGTDRQGTSGGTELLTILSGGGIGIRSTAPDAGLEINHPTGANLRLTYNDSDGSATNYADFSTSSGGNLTIAPSGGASNITGTLDVSGNAAFGSNGTIATDRLIDIDTTTTTAQGSFYSIVNSSVANAAITSVYGLHNRVDVGASGVINDLFGIYAVNPTNSGSVTSNYGIYVADQTSGTSDYGLAIAGADTQALWVGSGANNTDAANGIAFGSSRDTNLYRSAADTLRTDDAFNVNGNLNITSAGAISAATGLTSSGTITFSGFSSNGGILYTNGSGVLAQATAGTASQCLLGGTTPSFGSCSTGTSLSPFQQGAGIIFPNNSTSDFLVGGQATASAKFAVLNINSGTPVASVSSGLSGYGTYITADGTLATTRRQTLTIGNSSTYDTSGNVLINPNGTGFIGIGTTSPTSALDVRSGTLCVSDGGNCVNSVGDLAWDNSSGGSGLQMDYYGGKLFIGDSSGSDWNLLIDEANQRVGINTTAPDLGFEVNSSSGNNLRLTYNDADGSASNYTDFTLASDGDLTINSSGNNITLSDALTLSNYTTDGGLLYTNGSGVLSQTGAGTGSQCLLGGTTPTWGACSTGTSLSPFQELAGAIVPNNSTADFLVGGQASSSAKFAVLNVANGTPTASVSAGTAGGAYLSADGVIASTAKQSLTLGTATTGNIAIGTDATARTISLGNSTGTTALNFTSGTGAQTFTSSNATGTGTSSGFVFTANSLNTGTAGYINSSSITTGKLLNLATTGNTLTTGTLLNLSSTATSLTGAAGIGSMLNLDWSPGSTTNATGDLFALNIGGNGSTTGKLFNILDNSSSLFSVSETAVTSNLPASFNAAGDVSIAYDLVFTNPTASYITSNAPLSIRAGELFNSSNLTLGTYNKGNIIADTEAFVTNASATVSAQLVVGSAAAPANIGGLYLTNSRVFGKALAIFNQTENQDIFTASSSGTARFSITNAGGIRLGSSEGTSGQCLQSGGIGVAASWAACSTGSAGVFQQLAGSIVPNNSTLDFLVGGQASSSAKFAVLNVNGSTSPVASISATTASGGSGNGITLGGDGTIQSLRGNTLTLGGTTTGNIKIDSGSDTITLNDATTFTTGVLNSSVASGGNAFTLDADNNFSSGNLLSITENNGGTQHLTLDHQGNINLNATGTSIDNGNTLYGGAGSSQHLYLASTSNATKGNIYFHSTSNYITSTSNLVIGGDATFNGNNIGIGTAVNALANIRLNSTSNIDVFSNSIAPVLTIENLGVGGDASVNIEGGLTAGGTVTLSTFSSNGGVLYTNGSGVLAQATAGTSGQCLLGGTTPSFGSCSTGTNPSPFQELAGSIVPNNSTLDFLVGGQASSSAKFAVLNVNGSTSPVASISATTASGGDGNGITLGGDGTIQSLRGNTLTLGGTTTGNINVNNKAGSAFASFDTINSRLGIGTTAPSTKLQVVEGNVQESVSLLSGAGNQYAAYGLGNTGVNSWWAYVGGTGQYSALSVENDIVYKNAGGNVIHYIGNNTGNFKFSTGTSETLKMELTNSGLLGIGQSGPTSALYVTRPLSYGVTGKALAVFDQIESQDILAASASGATKFRIGNAGDITIYGDMLPATDDTIELGSTNFAYNTVWTNSVAAGGSDLAEYYKKSDPSELFEAGQLVCLSSNGGVTRCTSGVTGSILGVISDNAAFIGGSKHTDDDNYVLVGLVGQLDVKVTGDIKAGDALTISPTTGVAMKATKESYIIGRALQNNQNGQLSRVATSIQAGYFNPNLALNTAGDDTATFLAGLNISEQNGDWSIRDAAGNVVDRTSAFSNLVAATMKTGFLNAQKITTNSLTATTGVFTNFTSGVANITTATVGSLSVGSENVLIAGTSLRDYVAGIVQEVISDNVFTTDSEIVSPIASIDRINTNIISPLADGASIEIEVKPESIAINNTATGEKVTEIDNAGNATFSGQLASDTLKTNDATISGTLSADRIIANTIDGLDEKISSIASQLVAGSTQQATDGETSTNSGSLATNYQLPTTISELEAGNIYADFGIYSEGLTILGSTTTSQLTAMDSIAIGTGFIMTDNSINTLGATLEIQPLRQGAIDFMAGRVKIDTDGNVDIAGNLNVAGIINAPEGVFDNLRTNNLATNIISPLGDSDLTIKLGGDNQASSSSNLRVTGLNGNEVLKISGEGNIAASGSATFDKLNFNLVGEALADSDTTAIATGSAGFATLLRNKPEITIYNDKITANSLIYITPFGDTQNKVIHLLRQIPHTDTSDGSFTIGVSGTPANADIQFNWLIVN